MALPATLVCECRADGDDTNGGGYDSAAAGTDRSQQAAAHVTIDGATITATVQATTTDLLIVGYTVIAGDAGNVVNINGGTATAGRYVINSVNTGTNTWTLDRSAGTATQTATGKMGGAVKFPAVLTNTTGTTLVSGTKVWIKNGTYTLTTTTPGAAGPMSIGNIGTIFEGYQTTRGDRGTPPTISAGAQTGISIVASGGTNNVWSMINVKVDGNSGASNIGFAGGNRSHFYLCEAINCPGSGFATNSARVFFSHAISCGVGFNDTVATGCCAESCTTGFLLTASTSGASDCIAHSCTGDGFNATAGTVLDNCTSWGNGGDGFDLTGTSSVTVTNSISVGNTGYGYNTPATLAGRQGVRLIKNAAYNNTAGAVSNALAFNDGFVTLTGDPFVDAASENFSLNNTAGAGADCRAIAIAVHGQTSYGDLGPVQHQDPTLAAAFVG